MDVVGLDELIVRIILDRDNIIRQFSYSNQVFEIVHRTIKLKSLKLVIFVGLSRKTVHIKLILAVGFDFY